MRYDSVFLENFCKENEIKLIDNFIEFGLFKKKKIMFF